MKIYHIHLFSCLILVSSFLTIAGTAYGQSDADIEKVLSQLDNGKVVGNVYENKLLGLTLKFPKSMSPDAKETLVADVKDGLALLAPGRPADRRMLEEMMRKDRIVFTLDLPESDRSVGAALSLTVKKDESGEELKSMIERTIKFFTANGNQKLTAEPSDDRLGSLKVITFILSMDVTGGRVFSKIYCARRNGHLLTFSISYADEAGLRAMEPVLKGIVLS
jgi:hypothetical protein